MRVVCSAISGSSDVRNPDLEMRVLSAGRDTGDGKGERSSNNDRRPLRAVIGRLVCSRDVRYGGSLDALRHLPSRAEQGSGGRAVADLDRPSRGESRRRRKSSEESGITMIRRVDRRRDANLRAAELIRTREPAPAAVQELLGGKFGEMSTFLNCAFQSSTSATSKARGRSMTWSRASPARSSATSSWWRRRSTRCSPARRRQRRRTAVGRAVRSRRCRMRATRIDFLDAAGQSALPQRRAVARLWNVRPACSTARPGRGPLQTSYESHARNFKQRA